MSINRDLKHVQGLKELDKLLDSLVDPKFRKAALRNAARKAMEPVKESLKSKIPNGDSDQSSYKYYKDGKGYTSGDLKKGVKLRIKVNTDKKIKVKSNGYAKDGQQAELVADVTFDYKVYGLAKILENGRQRRVATTRNGKVFHAWGKPTDDVKRDIGTFEGKNFVSATYAEQEGLMVDRFKKELTTSIKKQVRKMEKANGK